MAPHRAPFAVLLAAAFLLAGCTTGDPGEDEPAGNGSPFPPGPTDPAAREAAAGNLPFWFPGLSFRYEVEHAGSAAQRALAITVLEGTAEQHWLLARGDEEAIWWSMHWGVPPIGALSANRLDPVRDGRSLGWFDLPLSDGKAWSGEDLDGTPLAFSAERTTVRLPEGGEAPAYLVIGSDAEKPRIGYTYAAEAGWFTTMWRDANGDGEPDARATLVSLAVELELRAEEPVEAVRILAAGATGPATDAPPAIPPVLEPAVQVEFVVPDDALILLVVHRFAGGAGLYRAVILHADQSTTQMEWLSDGSEPEVLELQAITPVPGDTQAILLVLAADGDATVDILAVVPAP